MINHRKLILLGGATASGKSSLALALATHFDGEIVNADSMQIYRELRCLTARPDAEEEAQCPHHLYGLLSGNDGCSVMRWREMAGPVLDGIWSRGRIPIVTGGTGLYFKALYEGLVFVPDIDVEVRHSLRQMMVEEPEKLYPLLEREDPMMAAQLNSADRQRITRALEVIRSTGRSLSEWQSQPPRGGLKNEPDLNIARIILYPPRETAYDNCNHRFDLMVQNGALEEVKHAIAEGYTVDTPVMKSLGAVQLAAYLNGEVSLEEAVVTAKMLTRQYAKRQMTWFRNQFSDWVFISSKEDEIIPDKIFL